MANMSWIVKGVDEDLSPQKKPIKEAKVFLKKWRKRK